MTSCGIPHQNHTRYKSFLRSRNVCARGTSGPVKNENSCSIALKPEEGDRPADIMRRYLLPALNRLVLLCIEKTVNSRRITPQVQAAQRSRRLPREPPRLTSTRNIVDSRSGTPQTTYRQIGARLRPILTYGDNTATAT